MITQLPHSSLEHVIIYRPDQAKLLDSRDELTASNDMALRITHPQQAFEIVYLSRRRAYHRLESKEQSIVAQRCLNRGAYGQVAWRSVGPDFDFVLAH